MADAVVKQRVLHDGTVIIDLRGELDIAVNESLRNLLTDIITTRRPPRMVVDMRHVVFVDSTGIGALVAAYHAATTAGVEFEVQQIAPFVEKQLRATGLYDLLTQNSGE
jgi:anti-anti-sigma factor